MSRIIPVILLGLGWLISGCAPTHSPADRDDASDIDSEQGSRSTSDEPPAPIPSSTGSVRKVAFLVGINDYKKPFFNDLKYAENDVKAIGVELRKLGFEVTVLTGQRATREAIDATVRRLVRPLGDEDLALVMLSGHGQELEVRPKVPDQFYCPVNAVSEQPGTLFSLSELTDRILAPNVGRSLVLVDACRDRRVKEDKGARGIQGRTVSLPEGIAVFFSCRSGQQSFEKDAIGHGLFTYCLLDGLRGAAARPGEREISWFDLVAHVNYRMSRQEIRDLLRGEEQDPLSSGAVPRIILGELSAGFEGTEAGDLWSENSLKMAFRWCPAGAFLMGSPEDERLRGSGELQHRVGLTRGFWLGQYEVTQSEYESVMGTNPSYFSSSSKGSSQVADQDTSVFPVESVSWEDAVAFCRKLTEQDRRTGTLPLGWEYRLPTEAQWEYACRAGTSTATSFGSSLSSRQANFDGDRPYNGASKGPDLGRPTRVGSYGPNAWGLHDLHGNVWEWCRDRHGINYYAVSPSSNPAGPSKASYRVMRGGSWSDFGQLCRAANRIGYTPTSRLYFLGFRVAAVPSGW